MGSFGTVVGIDVRNNVKMYRVLVANYEKKPDNQVDWKFNCTMMNEQQVVNSLSMKKPWSNIKLESGKIKGSSGSLDRFNSNGSQKPFVILSQIISNSGTLLGYKVANYEGGVKNIPLKEMLAYGNRANKVGNIPVQNAIFVPAEEDRKEHYKCYPNCAFFTETLIVKKHVENNKRVNTAKNGRTLNRLEEIYSHDQIKQLKLGKDAGVDIRIYANPALSAEQMRVLREALIRKVNIRPIAHPEYNIMCMRYYIECIENGVNIRSFLNPVYNLGQLSELSLAEEEGLDITKMNNPKLSAEEMAEIRERLERKIWKDELVKKDGTWK